MLLRFYIHTLLITLDLFTDLDRFVYTTPSEYAALPTVAGISNQNAGQKTDNGQQAPSSAGTGVASKARSTGFTCLMLVVLPIIMTLA
jgi:hypothetical protein